MAKAKAKKKTYANDDKALMLLAGAAAIIVGFFAIFAYKTNSVTPLPTTTPNQITSVELTSQNRSGEEGTVSLQEVDGKVVVSMDVTGFPKDISQPAHIHVGSCPNPASVKFPLTFVLNGESVTTIDTTLAQLKEMGPLAINIHKSASQSSIYYACGDLSF